MTSINNKITGNNSLGCFVLRNDGGCRSSLQGTKQSGENKQLSIASLARICNPCLAYNVTANTPIANRRERREHTQLSIVNYQLSIRKSRHAMIATFLLFGFFVLGMAQEIQLDGNDARNRETVSVRLYDNNEGNYLLELPLTFHITPNNILFMIVGDDNGITGNNALWMFDQTVALNDFQKRNKHIGAAKTFKKQIKRLESFFDQSENVEKFTWFDNGYEQVQASPKPVFFKVGDTSKPVVLKLKFYTSFANNNRTTELSSEAGTVKIQLTINN